MVTVQLVKNSIITNSQNIPDNDRRAKLFSVLLCQHNRSSQYDRINEATSVPVALNT